ncbi:CRISPR-associated helicase/endonuclease Cas3 [Marinobacterium litorale]|uniref:CRISPR-associated helicase/endonuclease Cas3 n=1 Tax=Marinobacterium litorale TaxID=404770 RepID=UPI000426084B|nr:CRISPR-associated helicase/endonuclease Cas3 [Marinobacterium litorale]
MPRTYFQYWGKARKPDDHTGDEYHLLAYHSLDVAAVGWRLLAPERALNRDLAQFLMISPEQLQKLFVFALMLHDLGKFASAFQNLVVIDDSPLCRHSVKTPYDAGKARHDRMGAHFWLMMTQGRALSGSSLGLKDTDVGTMNQPLESLNMLLDSVFGHHGKPVSREYLKSLSCYRHPLDVEAASAFVHDCVQLLELEWPEALLADREWFARLRQASWHLAGLAILCDWIGSNQDYFRYRADDEIELTAYWDRAKQQALEALDVTELAKTVKVQPFVSVQRHFGFSPTPLQRWAESVSLPEGPQLLILEDVTGAGKTEAALTLTHRLLAAGEADGLYFGLPTMATSNAMFGRVAEHYRQMLSFEDGVPSIVLAHGARQMHDGFREALSERSPQDSPYQSSEETASLHCNHWLADSRKKALLAPVGVGTIDQALLAALPRKHQPLRLLGLHRKVLIFDEVHSADSFMLELLEDLLIAHLRQGGSVILLTATLSQNQRQRLCRAWQKGAGLSLEERPLKRDFPLATHLDSRGRFDETILESRPEVSRSLKVDFLVGEQTCIDRLLSAREQKQCAVWIRNSVDDAIDAYDQLVGATGSAQGITLFHSRFTLKDRKFIEDGVLATFGKHSTSDDRKGQILISTQVFQESLDADADLMISDLCPIDDLIQRAGRLHRHRRDTAGNPLSTGPDGRPEPKLLVHAPAWQEVPDGDWLLSVMRNTEYVYRSPGKLWLGMRVLRDKGEIRMPEGARDLIEAVYASEAQNEIPEALQEKDQAFRGEERHKASQALNQILEWEQGYTAKSSHAWLDDDVEISTRFADREIVQVLVLKKADDGRLQLWAEGEPFALQNSIVKLAKNSIADHLVSLPETETAGYQVLLERYQQAKYLQPWLAEMDEGFAYSPDKGVIRHNREVE